MKHALLFRDTEKPILVSAEEVKSGRYDRYDEYVDPEYEFKVEYVKAAKNGGGPYFRLYYSYEEYKRLFPERADRYQIVHDMRRYEESEWHTLWKTNMADFCQIEWTIHDKERQQWKIADAYYADMKTCIEFQHSYISFHFEEKNEFYRALSLQTVWLYDLTGSNINTRADGSIDILEDNARGFFRISENANNLRDNFVYIQVKSGKIYRVTELDRRETTRSLKSTIRCFWPTEIYAEQEFIAAIQSNSLKSYDDILSDREKVKRQRIEQEREEEALRQQREAERLRQLREEEILQQQREIERKAQEEVEKKAAEEALHQREHNIQQRIQHANYEQTDEYIIIDGQRWVLCTRCNQPKKEQDMSLIGSGYYPTRNPNKGVCRDCSTSKD
jgi:hypothetical protein